MSDATENLDFASWRDLAEDAVMELAAIGKPFTAYDLTLLGVPSPGHPNHWGLLFADAHRWGVIVPIGYGMSVRRSRSGGSCHVWIGAEHLVVKGAVR